VNGLKGEQMWSLDVILQIIAHFPGWYYWDLDENI